MIFISACLTFFNSVAYMDAVCCDVVVIYFDSATAKGWTLSGLREADFINSCAG